MQLLNEANLYNNLSGNINFNSASNLETQGSAGIIAVGIAVLSLAVNPAVINPVMQVGNPEINLPYLIHEDYQLKPNQFIVQKTIIQKKSELKNFFKIASLGRNLVNELLEERKSER